MLSMPAPSTSQAGMAIEVAASNPSGNAYRFMHKIRNYLADTPTAPRSDVSLITRKLPSPLPDNAIGIQALVRALLLYNLAKPARSARLCQSRERLDSGKSPPRRHRPL